MTAAGDPRGSEKERLAEDRDWRLWGPYLADRQWGTVREDYSPGGKAWTYLPHDHARSRAYRWGEDGLLGITDRDCRLCFALALWNENDAILKERLFGLTGPQGNHGEDVKELYYYLDATPTFSYLAMLYKYPHAAFPYQALIEGNQHRDRFEPEFELEDTGVLAGGRYTDVLAEYAKAGPDDVLVRITCTNRGDAAVPLHVLPTLWLRNTWAWGQIGDGYWPAGLITTRGDGILMADHPGLGRYRLAHDGGRPLFTNNETNAEHLFGAENRSRFVKDGFHRRVIAGDEGATNPEPCGTKAALWHELALAPGEAKVLRLRLTAEDAATGLRDHGLGADFDAVFADRRSEADDYHRQARSAPLSEGERNVVRQSDAGLLCSSQFYSYNVAQWLDGDPAQPPPPPGRERGRNQRWRHLEAHDLILMPDKWEYPWFAAWDLAFHCVALARIDPSLAKQQLLLLCREWYMQPNGQIPAYEYAFGDVNPPVHAWAAWRVYQLSAAAGHGKDRRFLEAAFHKCIINFTWWVNRKDIDGNNLFAGGFLGLDNIGVFDRSKPLPGGGRLEQADATAWMAFYASTMLAIALELSRENPAYADIASKFFEHFVAIARAMNGVGEGGLWDDQDGYYYDQIHVDGHVRKLRVRSMVGLIPLYAAETLDEEHMARLPLFRARVHRFLDRHPEVAQTIACVRPDAAGERRLLAIPPRERLEKVLAYLVDENELLSPHGIRSLSKFHGPHPYALEHNGSRHEVRYAPGESDTGLFGGNSNWRGPVWFPVNYLLIEALKRHHHFYRDTLKVECPAGSGKMMNLRQVAEEIERRLASLFLPGEGGGRPCLGQSEIYRDPSCRDLVLFHEYFHGDSGRGLGASHQTGWTALAANILERVALTRGAR